MSSESEDEFQSADEGSDLESEDLECPRKAYLHPQVAFKHTTVCERVHCTQGNETQTETVLGKGKQEKDNSGAEGAVDKDNSSVEGAIDKDNLSLSITDKDHSNPQVVDSNERCKDDGEWTETVKKYEKSHVLGSSRNENIFESYMKSDENVEEISKNQLKEDKCYENILSSEICENKNTCVEELQERNIKAESEKKKVELFPSKLTSDEQNKEVQAKKDIEKDEELEKPECKLKVSSQSASENSKEDIITDYHGVHQSNSKSKQVKQSKIGLKKPREKLGERLGGRKLGTKVATKPSDAIISSDTIMPSSDTMKHNVEDKSISLDVGGGQTTIKNMEDKEQVDEKVKKRQQWEEQQERWHQALNLDKEKKEVSSGNDDGWSAPWGDWGNTLLSAASTFTREVGRGVGTVMETVESSIGVLSPEIMAQEICESKLKTASTESSTLDCAEDKEIEIEKNVDNEKGSLDSDKSAQQMEAKYGLGGFTLGSLVSGVSGALETASSKVLMGGLDTLEVIGRKAMDVIQEGDPGLRRKREFLSQKKPNLTQILQEARQRALEEERDGAACGRNKHLQKLSFEQAWESTEGPVHLEALSLVAKQCQIKKASMITTLPHYIQEKLLKDNTLIKNTCELDEVEQQEEDLAEALSSVLVKTGLPLNPQKLIGAWSSVQEKVTLIQDAGFEQTEKSEGMLYETIAQLVAQLCALTHKGAELALVSPETEPLRLASHFKELAQAVSYGLENMADQVCGTLTEGSVADDEISKTITHIYLQAANGNNYIQESLMLLSSVLQYSNTKSTAAHH